jgi:hypothetical protein
MRIQAWHRANREDLGAVPKEMHQAVDRLFEILNPQLEQLTDLARNNGTFADNANSYEAVLVVEQDTEVITKVKMKGKPVRAILVASAFYEYGRLKWRTIDSTTVAFAVKWDSDPGSARQVKIVFFGD